MFCLLACCGNLFGIDAFTLSNGYSFLWLMSLYFIGAYIKIYENDFKKYNNLKHLLLFIISIISAFVISTLIDIIKYRITGSEESGSIIISYISPFIVFSSIQLFLYFSKIKIQKFHTIINKISIASFGVYLISEQNLIRSTFITNKFSNFSSESWYIMIPKILLSAITIYILCTFVELARIFMFKKLDINGLIEKNVKKIKNLYK